MGPGLVRPRVVGVLAAVLIAMLGACSASGPNNQAGANQPNGSHGSSPVLPTTPAGVGNGPLPTVIPGSNDTVVVTSPVPSTTSTTTTTLPAPTTSTTIPPAIIPSDILFDTDKADLKPTATPYLQQLAAQIHQQHPNASLHFVGHTDSRGSAALNLDLSRRRAQAVLQWFASNGFGTTQLSSEGVGATEPLVPDRDAFGNYDETAGQRNRAVVILIGG